MEANVRLAIDGGAVVVQYRDKGSDVSHRLNEAETLLELCRSRRVPLIVNDDVDLARSIGADGVHVGNEDPPLPEARAALGSNAIIGVSCYNSMELALSAQSAGADYVAFGSFFPSTVKPDAVRASTAQLKANRSRLFVPVVAIGGINPDNGREVLEAGADFLAVIHAVFGSNDPRSAASRFAGLFCENADASVEDYR